MKYILFTASLLFFTISCSKLDSTSQSNITLSGSYATLLIVDNFLYAINEEELTTFDITDNKDPKELNKQNVGFDIENIYHNAGVLFIGSSTTLYIFSINEIGIPVKKSETEYNFDNQEWQPCDPVIANDEFAYVTLSTSIEGLGPCGGRVSINQLRIYDISDFSAPVLISITEMEFPKGLAIDQDVLYVCEGNLGVKVMDVSDPSAPILIDFLDGFQSYDLILKGNLMMVVGPSEIRQFDISDVNDIVYLSTINL